MKDIKNDFLLAYDFFKGLRVTRRICPEKNLFQRIEFVCDAMKYHNINAQIAVCAKYGTTERTK